MLIFGEKMKEPNVHLLYENKPIIMSLSEFLEEVNRDRCDEWVNYTPKHIFLFGIKSVMEWVEYTLPDC